MIRFFSILLIVLVSSVVSSQTVLVPGDIAFIGINSDEYEDDFSFLLLQNIENGTSINFTDNGWTASGGFNMKYPESHFTWLVDKDLEAGNIVHVFTYNGVEQAKASVGQITGDKMTVSIAGDQIIAYQGSKSEPNFIAAISFNQNIKEKPGEDFDGDSYSNSTTAMPPGLQLGITALHIYDVVMFEERDNSIYSCIETEGDKNYLLGMINNVENWMMDNDNPFVQYPFVCEFKVDLSTSVNQISLSEVAVYPNPAKDKLVIKTAKAVGLRLELYTSSGILVKRLDHSCNSQETIFDLKDLSTGIYILYVVEDKGTQTFKVFVEN